MDDTVLWATNGDEIINLKIFQSFSREYNITINETKTKLFAISSTEGDSKPLSVDGLTIDHCSMYEYLDCM